MWYHLIWDETPNTHLISSYSGLICIHKSVFPHSLPPSPQSTVLHLLFTTAYADLCILTEPKFQYEVSVKDS